MNQETKVPKWQCKHCGEKFESSSKLNQHVGKQHSEKSAKSEQERGTGRRKNLFKQWRRTVA